MVDILYEDNHLLVVVKPPHMGVMPDDSGDEDLLSLLKKYIKEKYQKPGEVFLGLVHRLDRPVGGVMVFARTSKAASRLQKAWQSNAVEKRYFAVCEGIAPQSAALTDSLLAEETERLVRVVGEGEGKQARLRYTRLACEEGLSLLAVTLHTGRKHQIRVQLAHHGLPIWGDQRYNGAARPGQNIALFAYALSFEHPTQPGRRMSFTCRPPHWPPWEKLAAHLDAPPRELGIVYEDENVVVVNKPQGLPVQGAQSVESALRAAGKAAMACHRLDVQTGGLVLLARTQAAWDELTQAFAQRRVYKTYECLALGDARDKQGVYTAYAVKDAQNAFVHVYGSPRPGAKTMVTELALVERRGEISRLRVTPHTGRTHQIRAHLTYMGLPILGDDKYGDREANRRCRVQAQALWSTGLHMEMEEGSPLAYLNDLHWKTDAQFPPFWGA